MATTTNKGDRLPHTGGVQGCTDTCSKATSSDRGVKIILKTVDRWTDFDLSAWWLSHFLSLDKTHSDEKSCPSLVLEEEDS